MTISSKLRNGLIAAAILAGAILAGGCGESENEGGDQAAVTGSEGRIVAALTSRPLRIVAQPDATASHTAPRLLASSLDTVRNAFELAMAQGGSFDAELVGGDLTPIDLIAPVEVPDPGGGRDEIERADVAETARSQLAAAGEALAENPSVADLEPGSAIADNLRRALERLAATSDPDSQGVVVVASDGADDVVKDHLDEAPTALAERLGSRLGSGIGKGAVVLIAGVGMGANGTPGAAAFRLRRAWEIACAKTGALCSVSIEAEQPLLLEAIDRA